MAGESIGSRIITGVLVVCAVVVTAAVVKREFLSSAVAAAGPDLRPRLLANAAGVASAGQPIGRPDAPVKIVEFSDFQCPFCGRMAATLKAVQRRHPNRVVVLYRHFPLDAIHPHARLAAQAAECAAEQGRFEQFHDALFARQPDIGTAAWADFARTAGVPDAAAFQSCVDSGRHAATVERDARAAAALKLEVTPSLIIDGELRPGVVSEAELERWVEGIGNRE